MRCTALALLVVFCLTALAAPAYAGDTKPASLKELGRALDDLVGRIEALIEEAGRDPDERKVAIYEKYDADQLKLKKREVTAEDLVGFMINSPKFNLRSKARDALKGGALRGDVDLSRSEKKRGMSKRAYFSLTFLVANLDHDDGIARKMCWEVLDAWWRVRDVSAILAYDLQEKKTWSKAKNAWKRYLRRN